MRPEFDPGTDPLEWLAEVLAAFDCQTGTLHRADGRHLDLVAHIGVPEALIPKITRIPFGKGIAGVAAESRQPVELCNLQQDLGGVARPDARQTKVSGSLAVPVLAPDGATVMRTLGIGMLDEHEFSPGEKTRLGLLAAEIGRSWAAESR